MTFDAQHHCFASPLDHLSFPRGFAFQVSQFTDMMYFYLTASDAAPFALRCEQASTQFIPALVHPRFRDQVHLPIRDCFSFQLFGRGDEFILFDPFPFFFQRNRVSAWPFLEALHDFLDRALPFGR